MVHTYEGHLTKKSRETNYKVVAYPGPQEPLSCFQSRFELYEPSFHCPVPRLMLCPNKAEIMYGHDRRMSHTSKNATYLNESLMDVVTFF